jgi:hypothetical protein
MTTKADTLCGRTLPACSDSTFCMGHPDNKLYERQRQLETVLDLDS